MIGIFSRVVFTYHHFSPHILIQIRRACHMLNGHNLTVSNLKTLVPWQRQIHIGAHRDDQLFLHFGRIETLVTRVQSTRQLLVLANSTRPILVIRVLIGHALAHILCEYIFEIVVRVFVFADNVDELLVLLVSGGELLAFELWKGKWIL